MKSALIGAMVGTATGMMCPSTPAAWPAAGMKITTNATVACQFVEEEITARINGQTDWGTGAKWHDPHNNGKYTLDTFGGTVVHTLEIHRVTGDGKYTDKQIFELTPIDVPGCANPSCELCKIEACSRSQVTSIFDMGTNYCDLKMLYCGKKDTCKPVKNDFEVGMEKTESFSQASVDLEKCFTKADVVNVKTLTPAPSPTHGACAGAHEECNPPGGGTIIECCPGNECYEQVPAGQGKGYICLPHVISGAAVFKADLKADQKVKTLIV